MRRSLETEERSETASLLNALPTVTSDITVRELYTAETLPARVTQSSLAGTQALDAVALQAAALQLARREKIRQRGRAIETAVNGDGGPFQQFANVFETFAIALASGMAEADALQRAARDAPDTAKALFMEIAAQIEQGVPLLQALRKHEDALPDIVIPIFEHGTIYGTAENASRQLARALKHLARVEEKFEYSALNPGMTIPLMAGGIMILALLPVFLIFTNPLEPYLTICAACLSVATLSWKFRHKLAARKVRGSGISRLALKGIGNGFVKQMGAARWSRTFAALWHCGVPISSALEAAGRSTRNAYYERVLCEAALATRNGQTLGDSLAHVGLLKGEMIETIRTGEMTGELGPALEKWADVLEADAKERSGVVFFVKTFGLLFLIALIACIVCLIVSYIVVGIKVAAFKRMN